MVTSRPLTQRGHETPFLFQFSIFLPNRVGQLGELLGLMTEAQVEPVGVSIVDSSDWSVVRMIFTDPDRARDVLARRGLSFTECEVLAVVLDGPHTFRLACRELLAAELNIHFAYPLMIRRDDCPVLVLHVDNHVMAIHVLTRRGFTLLDHEDT